jgi:hypothetical protein
MRNERDLDTKPAGKNAYAASVDAGRYSDECQMLYTPKQRAAAQTFQDIVNMAYSAKQTYLTYRKTFVAVKLVNAIVRDRKILRELESICNERGYVKVNTAQGITFRMPRVA